MVLYVSLLLTHLASEVEPKRHLGNTGAMAYSAQYWSHACHHIFNHHCLISAPDTPDY